MSTTARELSEWFDEGVKQGAAYMVVICDTFDWDDYPSYFKTRESAQRIVDHPGSMQKVMEVYDLKADKAAQFAGSRTWAIKPSSGETPGFRGHYGTP
jgi:hypothetical protein